MARKRKEEAEAEEKASKPQPAAEGMGKVDEAVTEVVDRSAELTPGPQVRERKTKPKEPAEPPPVPKRYVVQNGGRIIHNGNVTFLKPGKVVDEREFNIPQLEQQGIQLQPAP